MVFLFAQRCDSLRYIIPCRPVCEACARDALLQGFNDVRHIRINA